MVAQFQKEMNFRYFLFVFLFIYLNFFNIASGTPIVEEKWDYLMLVQRWPQATCQIVNASGHPCHVPGQVKGWTIHGLWPSSAHSYPSFCQPWKFNETMVQDLKDVLLKVWPNLYIEETEDSLWKHEYEKHGTCAASITPFITEHEYFQRTLELTYKYDVQRVLEFHSIFPRAEGYETGEIVGAMKSGYNTTTCPGCGYVKGVGQIMSQTYVCIDKHLQLINCPVCEKQCDPDLPVLYQPLHCHPTG